MSVFVAGADLTAVQGTEMSSDTGGVKHGQGELTFLPRPNWTSR